MAALYWLGATLVGLVLGIVAGTLLIVEYIGYAIGVGAAVIASRFATLLPGHRAAAWRSTRVLVDPPVGRRVFFERAVGRTTRCQASRAAPAVRRLR